VPPTTEATADESEEPDGRNAALRAAGERAATLHARLGGLPVVVDDARCTADDVDVPSYPDGPRPSSTVTLRGLGVSGRGEHVGWTRAAHASFAARIANLPLSRCRSMAEVTELATRLLAEPYDRAALEAAALDLALRQAGTSLQRLAGGGATSVRYVVSFERTADPVARAEAELAAGAPGLKVDVDPAWGEATYAALARLGRVAVLDFKRSGSPVEHERAHRHVPEALLEDPLPGREPWSAALLRRWSVDAPVTSAAALAALSPRPAALNVKPARMGGVLEALAAVAWAGARDVVPYVGGMFEVGIGRPQLRALAAVLCPDGPNDVAPIPLAGRPAERPARLPAADPGTGFARHRGEA
jgi:L-alanine-DL-glutamate epimerase-like enolase superfamily enzyme